MLARVSVGQMRFNLPGLSADGRGVATGKELLLRFGTLDRVLDFLRLLSAERTPETLWVGVLALYARPGGGGAPRSGVRELYLRVPNPGGQLADLVAVKTRLAGGSPHTGTRHHFVPMRDAKAPLGFDASTVQHEDADFTLYDPDGARPWKIESEVSLERLVLRLELRRVAGGIEAAVAAAGAPLHVAVRRGLAPAFGELLWRQGVDAEVAVCELQKGPFGGEPDFWLFRVPGLPRRLLGLCTRTPGLTAYLPAADDILAEAGFRHPVHLASCRAAFAENRYLLLRAPPCRPLEVLPSPRFVALGDVVKVRLPGPEASVPLARAIAAKNQALEVPLRLERFAGPLGPPKALLVPWSQAAWFSRLLYAMPTSILEENQVAIVEAGILVLAPVEIRGLPFGQLLEEMLPGVLVPLGTRLRPALTPALLRERLGINDGSICVFPATGADPFRVPRASFEPLGRRALSRAEIPLARSSDRIRPSVGGESGAHPPEISNDPLGLLPLWGWRP